MDLEILLFVLVIALMVRDECRERRYHGERQRWTETTLQWMDAFQSKNLTQRKMAEKVSGAPMTLEDQIQLERATDVLHDSRLPSVTDFQDEEDEEPVQGMDAQGHAGLG